VAGEATAVLTDLARLKEGLRIAGMFDEPCAAAGDASLWFSLETPFVDMQWAGARPPPAGLI